MEGFTLGSYRDELLKDALKHLHLSIYTLIELNAQLLERDGLQQNKQFARVMAYLGDAAAGIDAIDRLAGGRPADLYLAVETTGPVNRIDEVLNVAIIDAAGAVVFDELVKPSRISAWYMTEKHHGITPADVEHAKPLALVLPGIIRACVGQRVIVFSATYDLQWLPGIFDVAGDVRCSMRAAGGLDSLIKPMDMLQKPPAFRRQKLASVMASMHHPWSRSQPHRAVDIARACRLIWESCTEKGFSTKTMEGSL